MDEYLAATTQQKRRGRRCRVKDALVEFAEKGNAGAAATLAELHARVKRRIGQRVELGLGESDDVPATVGLRESELAERVDVDQSVPESVGEHRANGRCPVFVAHRPLSCARAVHLGQPNPLEIVNEPLEAVVIQAVGRLAWPRVIPSPTLGEGVTGFAAARPGL
jgi:hypothetical protein